MGGHCCALDKIVTPHAVRIFRREEERNVVNLSCPQFCHRGVLGGVGGHCELVGGEGSPVAWW